MVVDVPASALSVLRRRRSGAEHGQRAAAARAPAARNSARPCTTTGCRRSRSFEPRDDLHLGGLRRASRGPARRTQVHRSGLRVGDRASWSTSPTRHAQGRIVSSLEGGYELSALGRSAAEHVASSLASQADRWSAGAFCSAAQLRGRRGRLGAARRGRGMGARRVARVRAQRGSSTCTGAPSAHCRARARDELRLPVSVCGDAMPSLKLREPVAARPSLQAENGTRVRMARRRRPRAQRRRVLGDLRAQARVSDARGSFIRYQRTLATSDAHVIHCCADHSVYDPAEGARVVSGPAPQPLAAILLEHDAADDGVVRGRHRRRRAVRRVLRQIRVQARARIRRARRATPSSGTTIVRELTNYCRNTIQC